MGKKICLKGLMGIVVVLALVWGVGLVRAQDSMDEPNQENNEAKCCTCFSDTCCLLVDASSCDAEGNLKDSEFLNFLFSSVGVKAEDICNLCDQCAQNVMTNQEDAKFLDICDICLFDPLFDAHECTVQSSDGGNASGGSESEANMTLSGSGCQLNPLPNVTTDSFVFLGSILALGISCLNRRNRAKAKNRLP
jgi:hypothetical protein